MDKHLLKAEKREITGKKVKNLRLKGLLPANIYGKGIKSLAIEIDLKEFLKIFNEVGETGLVDLKIGSETRPVLIKNVQMPPVADDPLHADFYQVNLKEKVTSKVPVKIVGQAKAVINKIGTLLTILDEIEVEALPADLPENIELDVTGLKEIDQELKVKDLKVDSSKIEIKTDTELTLVKIGSLVTDEMKKEIAAEEAAKAAATAAPAEGTKPAEAGIPEEKKPESKEPPKKEEGKKE